MISGIFHEGSGLGNQLHRYVMTRVLAADKGWDFVMIGVDKFKGHSFMQLPKHLDIEAWEMDDIGCDYFMEKRVEENGVDIRSYDPEINFVGYNTVIDGEFQDERYFEHRLDEIDEWLKVEPPEMDDDMCIIGFRGGEFTQFPDLFLPKEYWSDAIKMMREINPKMRFQVHTDDLDTAQAFFPEFVCIHEIGENWRSIRYAKYAIIANSSFYILPRLLSGGYTIAPRYWARRNTGTWALPSNFYKAFTYL